MAVVDASIEIQARQAVGILARHVEVAAAYVFGSHVDGTPDEWSDIDVAVFAVGAENWDLFEHADLSYAVHKEMGRDVELHYFPASVLPEPERASSASWVIRHGVFVPVDGNSVSAS